MTLPPNASLSRALPRSATLRPLWRTASAGAHLAVPAHFVSLGVALGAAIARPRNGVEHLRQRLLATDRRLLGQSTGLTGSGATPFARRRLCCRRCVGLNRTFAGVDGGAVWAKAPNQWIAKRFLD